MARVKGFRILQKLCGTMKCSVSLIWKICNNLTTLLPPLHPHSGEIHVMMMLMMMMVMTILTALTTELSPIPTVRFGCCKTNVNSF